MCDEDYGDSSPDDVDEAEDEHLCELCNRVCDCGGLVICYWCCKCNEDSL